MNQTSEAFADVIRKIMRVATSESDQGGQKYWAAEKLALLVQDIHNNRELNFHELVDSVVAELQVVSSDTIDGVYVDLAKRGTKFLLESSCRDSASAGRASSRRTSFKNAIENFDCRIEEIRSSHRKEL